MQQVQGARGPHGQRTPRVSHEPTTPRVYKERSRRSVDWKRVAVLGVLGGTLVTLLARAAGSPTPPPIVAPPPPPVEDTASLFADVDRLRERLRSPVQNATPSRNLFAFRSTAPVAPRKASSSSAESAGTPIPVPEPSTRTPPLSLIGLAEHAGPSGPVRTAILSDGGGLHFAEVGVVVAGYRLSAIREDAVELIAADGVASGTPIVLTFK